MSGFSIEENSHFLAPFKEVAWVFTKVYAPKELTVTIPPSNFQFEKKEEETMDTYNTSIATEAYVRSHLTDRLYTISTEKTNKMREFFHLVDDEIPNTPKEIVDRILAGKYVLPKEYEADDGFGSDAFYAIKWRDPNVAQDQEGFDKANEKRMKVATDVRDAIVVFPKEKALEILREYEATPFH